MSLLFRYIKLCCQLFSSGSGWYMECWFLCIHFDTWVVQGQYLIHYWNRWSYTGNSYIILYITQTDSYTFLSSGFSFLFCLWACESTIFTLSILEIQFQILLPYLFMRNHSIALQCLFFFCYRYYCSILDNVWFVLAGYIGERAIMHKY